MNQLQMKENLIREIWDYFLKYARDSTSAFLAAAAPKRLVSFILVDKRQEISIFFFLCIWRSEYIDFDCFSPHLFICLRQSLHILFWSQVCCELVFLFPFFAHNFLIVD